MFILRFIRFLQGYVRFEAQGGFVERFLNLVARDRIPVWDGRKRGDTYTGCVRAGAYRKLRRHAKKTGVKLSLVDKEGAPFYRRRYRRRTGVLAGLLLFALFLGVMSGFIWRLEVSGTEKLEDWEVLEALERIGVKAGTWRASIDVRESERLAMLQLEDLSWIALNIQGSTIHVEVSERTPPPLMIDPNTPCNVVATHTGQILTMRVYEGQALLREGDTVMAGDVIVSGITEDRLGQNLFRHAQADITARVEHDITVSIPLRQSEYVETGKTRNRRYLQLLGLDLPVHLPGQIPRPFRVEREESPWSFFGVPLPVSLLKETYILMQEVPVTLTEEKAKAMALRELEAMEQAQLGGGEILQREMQAAIQDGSLVLQAHYTCILEIGVEREILQAEG